MTGLRRYANKRDANEAGIVDALESLGCLVYRMDKPVDLLVLHRSRVFLVEVKAKKGKLTSEQEAFSQLWPIYVVRSVDDAVAFVKSARAIVQADALERAA